MELHYGFLFGVPFSQRLEIFVSHMSYTCMLCSAKFQVWFFIVWIFVYSQIIAQLGLYVAKNTPVHNQSNRRTLRAITLDFINSRLPTEIQNLSPLLSHFGLVSKDMEISTMNPILAAFSRYNFKYISSLSLTHSLSSFRLLFYLDYISFFCFSLVFFSETKLEKVMQYLISAIDVASTCLRNFTGAKCLILFM